ncbi:peptidoglycan-binding protein [Patescibacteria group bacterium]|nr:peptidoglycan-binding protein [Patescibacteria group bacterium]
MSLLKKIVSIATVLTVLVWAVSPVMAVTIEELEAQIAALLAQLSSLQSQLADLKGEAPPGVCPCTFTRNLYPEMSGDDVKCLQEYLNDTGYTLADSGPGSPGSETTYFGPLTRAAVKAWQDANGVEYGDWWGYFGPKSQAAYDDLCAIPVECTTDADCPTGYVCTAEECVKEEVPPVAAGLGVALAADTSAAASVANNANANFTKFTLTAGSEGDVSISKIYVTRSGLSSNSAIENIKIVDVSTGVYHGSLGSLNVDNRAMITFVPNLVISAGTSRSFYIRAGVVESTTTAPAGNTAALGIGSADDITSDASEITGSFPVTGNTMTFVSITIGSADVDEETTVDSTPDIGDTDVKVLAFKVSAGSTEAITIEQITVMEAGTAALDDTTDIELYSVTDSKSLGTVASWNSEGKASWPDLDIVVDKGETHRFKVMLDIVGGSGLTINADLVDGSDVLMTVKGNTYGFYITPSSGTWLGTGTGKGTDQNIQEGSLTISISADTPATGNIAPSSDQELTVFDFYARGEEVKISALHIDFDFGSMTYDELTNIKVYDEDGGIVCGPKDAADTNDVDFTDTFIVPVGTHQYTVKAKIASACETDDYVETGIDTPDSDITAKGMTTNESITPSPTTAIEGNRQTVAAGALLATTLTEPQARNVAKGIHDFVWMTGSLSAGTSGEDVNVTSITVTDTRTGTGTGGFVDIDNCEIWADLTTENSARGDIYETKVSDTEFPTAAGSGSQAFSLTQTITVPKGTYIKIAFVGDLSTGATTDDIHTIDISAVTATGADTGASITVTPSGPGQGMTVKASGELTVTKDASSPTSDIIIGQKTSTLAVFRLAATEIEDLDLDSIYISVTGGNYVNTYYFYSSARSDGVSADTPIQTAQGGTTNYVAISDGTVTVPANGHVELTVKGLLNQVGYGLTLTDDGDVQVGFDGSTYIIESTGLASGAEANSDDSVAGNTMYAFESRPYFAVNSASPSGNLIPSSQTLLATFDVTAEDTEDITFEDTDSNQLIVQINAYASNSDGSSSTWYLKDGDGTQLSSVTVEDDQLNTSGSVTFLFEDNTGSTNAFTVPAGLTKQLKVYGDTTDFEANGDTLQLWLDDGNNANCKFGIDGEGNLSEGVIVFRGDIFAGSFVNPE